MTATAHPAFPAGSAVGEPVPRASARYLVAGRGTYTDDITLPRQLHVYLLRSPIAHGRIRSLDSTDAARMPGVVRIVGGAEIARVCRPMRTALLHVPQHVSPEQPILALDEVTWQGQPVLAIAALSRAEAEDAAEQVLVEWEELPAIADPAAALDPDAALIQSGLASNRAFSLRRESGEVDRAFRDAAVAVAHDFSFGRITGVPLEPRTILADYNSAEGKLTIFQSHQSPHFLQGVYATHLGLPEHKVRVVARDVGGAFGTKLHVYPDEMAVAALAVLLGRPVKLVCDRLEAFQSDAHAREAQVRGRMAVDGDGRILAIDAEIVCGIGAASIYPRSGLGECLHATLLGDAYDIGALRTALGVAYQNKPPSGAFRGVGQPLSCAVTEQLLDLAAAELGLDSAEIRRRNHLTAAQLPRVTRAGLVLGSLSLDACLDKLLAMMDYAGLRTEQAELRRRGVHRGIGLATFLEQTAPGAGLYGPAGTPVTAQDSCELRIEPSGVVRCRIGCTDQGQGTLTGVAQIVASTLGLPVDDVAVSAGDSDGPQGGGAWASRGLAIGGEAALLAARALRGNLLSIAAAILQAQADRLDIRDRSIVDAGDGAVRLSLAELCRMAYFRHDLLPPGTATELSVTRSYVPRTDPYFVANGVQASHLEIDIETGWIRLLGHWVVEDCGRIVNPMLVDEQIRGGVVQGLGAALFEHCRYDDKGQLLTGNLAEYLVPMAAEMPDIVVGHIETPQAGTELGLRGAGEAGTIGASAAVWCAVNDALRPLGVQVGEQPFTPDVLLRALNKTNRPRGE